LRRYLEGDGCPVPTYAFTLFLDGADPLDLQDAPFNAGCDDATFGESEGVSTAHFDREAPELASAIVSAMRAVESVNPSPLTPTAAWVGEGAILFRQLQKVRDARLAHQWLPRWLAPVTVSTTVAANAPRMGRQTQ
jgi:hypothetical protein